MYELPPISKIWFERCNLSNVRDLFSDRLSEWPDFVEQLFGKLLFDSQTTEMPVDEQNEWVRNAFNMLEDMPDFADVKSASAYHPSIAAEYTDKLSHTIAEAMNLRKLPRDDPDSPEQIQSMVDYATENGYACDDIKHRLNKAKLNRTKCILKAESSVEFKRQMKMFAEDATDQQEIVKVFNSFGLGGDKSKLQDGIPHDLIQFILHDKELLKLIKSLGGLRQAMARNELMSPSKRGVSISGVKCDDRLEDLLSSELVKLNDPILKIDLLDRLANKKALVWEKKAKTPREHGDILLMLDKSGSMTTPMDTSRSRNEWATAVAVATVLKALRDKRTVYAITFNSWPEGMIVKSHDDLKKFMAHVTARPSGGTNMGNAFEYANLKLEHLNKPEALIVCDMEIPDNIEIEPQLTCKSRMVLITDSFVNADRVKEQTGVTDIIDINPDKMTSTDTDHVASQILQSV